MENTSASSATAPVGARIGENVRRLRRKRGYDLRTLSAELAEAGHPISLGQLSKLELGQRRVDVDDLVALAVVLNVTPGQLLMPEPTWAEDDVVALTPHRHVTWMRAWQWMCGDLWLDDAQRPASDDEEYAWYEAARPHDPTGVYNFSPAEAAGREGEVQDIVAAVERALGAGLTRNWVLKAMSWYTAITPERASAGAKTRG